MLNWMLWTKNDLQIFHRNHVNVSPSMKLVTSLINFECQPCGIFEGLSYHQEDEFIDPIIFAATAGLENRVPPRKPPDPVKDLNDGQIYDLKTRVDIWTRMDVVPVEYGTFALLIWIGL